MSCSSRDVHADAVPEHGDDERAGRTGARVGIFFFSSRRRHTRFDCDWSSDVCSSDLKLHREVVLLAGWGRAILLQIAHPLVAQGVADHSGFAAERWARVGRLKRTVEAMLALTFGTPEESAAAAAGINRIHDRVHGRLPQPAGAFASGSGYSAHATA